MPSIQTGITKASRDHSPRFNSFPTILTTMVRMRRFPTGQAPLSPSGANHIHPSPEPSQKDPGSPWCDNASHEYAFQTQPERRTLRARADERHPFCQDEKTRLPAEMLRLDSRTICFLEFEPPDFCSSFRPSSTMNRLRKAAFESDSKSSHWGRFPMGRFFTSASTYT